MTLLINFLVLLLHVELSEEVERYDRVNVHDDGQQHDSQHQLLAVVRDRLQDRAQRLKADGHVQQMGGKEEVVEVTENGEGEVPEGVQEGVVCYRNACFPYLIAPVNAENSGRKKKWKLLGCLMKSFFL